MVTSAQFTACQLVQQILNDTHNDVIYIYCDKIKNKLLRSVEIILFFNIVANIIAQKVNHNFITFSSKKYRKNAHMHVCYMYVYG